MRSTLGRHRRAQRPQISFRSNRGEFARYSAKRTKGETHDDIQTGWRGRSASFLAGEPRNGASLVLEPRPRAEPVLCDKGCGQSAQQVLRLPGVEQMALARRVGQH